jgi:hypothetical protein
VSVGSTVATSLASLNRGLHRAPIAPRGCDPMGEESRDPERVYEQAVARFRVGQYPRLGLKTLSRFKSRSR